MNRGPDAVLALVPVRAFRSGVRLFFDLFKLRIGLVIGVTAVAGAAVTPGPELSAWKLAVLAFAVTLASAAAGAFNQYAERDLDRHMLRTRRRAFVTGRLVPGPAWIATIVFVAIAGIAVAGVAFNGMTALYTLLGAFTYGIVYTVWLKRRTWWNIVVGGLAGSFAVLAGAAAVDPGSLDPLPLAFAIVLFLWTPPHFWSLAIAYRADYEAAGVPMLPVVVGDARAARAVYVGAAVLVTASLVPSFLGINALYTLAALSGGGYLLWTSARLARTPSRRAAMVNFHASLIQLTLLLVAAIAEAALRG